MIKKIIFDDGHEYNFNRHPALQNLSKENIDELMELFDKQMMRNKKW